MEKALVKFRGVLQWPVCVQPGIASIPDNFHEPGTRIAATEAGKESESSQVCFLDHVLCPLEIVHQGERLNEFRVEAQGRAHRAGNLCDFKRVGQPIAKMIGEAGAEDLRLRFEPPECAGMDDAVAVARIFAAVGMRGFGKPPAAGGCRVYCPGSVCAKRFDCRNLRRSGETLSVQDCGASSPRPRSASSATLVFG